MTARLVRLTRTILAVLAGVALGAGGTAAVSVAATAAPATIRVTGTVSDSGGFPLGGVIVQVVRADREEGDFEPTRTDAVGHFATTTIPVDANTTYQLAVTDPTGRHLTTYSKEFAAIAANRTQNVTMAAAAVIRGKVSTKDGDIVRPATGILIEANGTDTAGNPAGRSTFTSTKGAFSLGSLPSGTYSLVFTDYDEDGSREGPRFSTICYDNVPRTDVEPDRCASATLVRVTAGKVTTLNPQVLDHKLGSLSGKVTSGAGSALNNVTVNVYAAGDPDRSLGEDRTADGGKWTINGIDYVGKIKVVARYDEETYRTTWYKNSANFAGATALPLKDQGEISGLTIVMPRK